MKQILYLLVCLLTVSLHAQNFEDSWVGHFSYVSVKSISQGDAKIYAGAENSVFTYDLTSKELETLSTINGLSGEMISTIYYSEDFNLLVIGYENGLIDIVLDGEENILTVVDILDKPTIPPDRKRINHFYEYNGNLYIAAQFGISVYDLSALEFGDTYFIGDLGAQIDITQTTVKPPFIYASSSNGGVRRALVDNDNLIDFEQWNTLANGNYIGIQAIGDEVYIARSDDRIFRFTPGSGFVTVGNLSSPIVDFGVQENVLTITTTDFINAYDEAFNQVASVTSLPEFDFKLQAGYVFDATFYLGTEEQGMLEVPFGSNQAEQLLPNGPILNQAFAMDFENGQLWTAFGDVDAVFDPFPRKSRGISNFRDETWTNIPFDALFGATDLVNVVINPNDPTEVYMSSYGEGLLKINDQTPEVLFNQNNSNNVLVETFANNGDREGVRIYGAEFNREGDLWFVQSRRDRGLIRLTSGGQFQAVDITPIEDDAETLLALGDLSVSREGYVFFAAVGSGVIGYNPTNNKFNKIGNDVGNGNLPTSNVSALTFDNNNRLWIGTLQGVRVFFNVGGFFEENANTESQEIIILEDGIPQEFLFDIAITDIEVDGSNNKWIATGSSGVFYVSPNGQETLLRFTKDNSPLPTDVVLDIAIDDISGTVYFATDNGIVAFKGSSTAPRDNLEEVYAFPNPVRPGFEGNVTIDGLTANANVKITDIEGNLVFEETSEGGSVLWDTTAFGRYKVRSGVYMVLITTDDALETKVSKIMIVR